MNPQGWIALAALAVSVLGALFGTLTRYAMRQREAAVDAQIKALGDRVSANDTRITNVETKFEEKLDALLSGQEGIQKDIGAIREKMAYDRGSQCGIDAQVKTLSESLVTREVFEARMSGLDHEIQNIKLDTLELKRRRA